MRPPRLTRVRVRGRGRGRGRDWDRVRVRVRVSARRAQHEGFDRALRDGHEQAVVELHGAEQAAVEAPRGAAEEVGACEDEEELGGDLGENRRDLGEI